MPPTKNKDINDLEALLKQCSCHKNTSLASLFHFEQTFHVALFFEHVYDYGKIKIRLLDKVKQKEIEMKIPPQRQKLVR